MATVLFVLDTSPLMFERAFIDGNAMTYLDIAKQTVEKFLRKRKNRGVGENDRYLLMTCELLPNNIKSSWRASLETFMTELKNLQQSERQLMGFAIKQAFDFLNLNWLRYGIDRFGNGRCPLCHDPTMIVVLSHGAWADDENLYNLMQSSNCDLVKRRYRWDQRLFIIALRIPGNYVEPRAHEKRVAPLPYDEVMNRACKRTGGRSYSITSGDMLKRCILQLVGYMHPGVVIDFFNPTLAAPCCEVRYVENRSHCGYWPIPESYWVELICEKLPPREAHPQLWIDVEPSDEPDLENFPVDSYQLRPLAFVTQILSNAQPGKVLPVYVKTGTNLDKPFGYLKPNVERTTVKLIVLAYDYPVLLPLMRDLIHTHQMVPPRDWIERFKNYAFSIPRYYHEHLRQVFRDVMQIPDGLVLLILPRLQDYMHPSAVLHLKKTQLKATKVQQQVKKTLQRRPAFKTSTLYQIEMAPLMETGSQPACPQRNIVVPTNVTRNVTVYNYRNPYHIPRRELIDSMAKMRDEFCRNTL